MTTSLNKQFKMFLSQLQFVEEIDNLDLPTEFNNSKRADFLVENRKVIIELKSLESDPEYKIHKEIKNYLNRNTYPILYGKMPLSEILRHIPKIEREKLQNKLLYKISRSIEQSFREADKQIGATKTIFKCTDSSGLLILLNEDIPIFSPQVILYRLSQLLTKTDNDGNFHYQNITSVWFILKNFSLKTKKGARLFPSIVIDGPSATDKPELTNILNKLQVSWAAFNKMPYVTGTINKIFDSDFIHISKEKKEI